MYCIITKHPKKQIFNHINKIGIFSPRLNVVYLFDMNKVSKTLINLMEKNVICYA